MALRVGVIGSGWGARVQVPRFREIGLEVVAIYSRSEDRAKELAEKLQIKHPFWDAEALCQCEDVDLVSIVSPPMQRLEWVRAAIKAGKHILTEKPMAPNASIAREMLAASQAASASGKRHFVDFELRCTPAHLRARELIASGALGELQLVTVRAVVDFAMLQAGPEAVHTHWNSRECGGGVWSAVGTHHADIISFLLGKPVVRVSALETRPAETLKDSAGIEQPFTAEATVSAHLELEGSGPACHVLLSGVTPGAGLPMEHMQLIVGSKGSICICMTSGRMELFLASATLSPLGAGREAGGPTETVEGHGGNMWADVGTPQLGLALRMALEDPGPGEDQTYKGWRRPDPEVLASFMDGVVSQQVADAVHASAAARGQWMDIADF